MKLIAIAQLQSQRADREIVRQAGYRIGCTVRRQIIGLQRLGTEADPLQFEAQFLLGGRVPVDIEARVELVAPVSRDLPAGCPQQPVRAVVEVEGRIHAEVFGEEPFRNQAQFPRVLPESLFLQVGGDLITEAPDDGAREIRAPVVPRRHAQAPVAARDQVVKSRPLVKIEEQAR